MGGSGDEVGLAEDAVEGVEALEDRAGGFFAGVGEEVDGGGGDFEPHWGGARLGGDRREHRRTDRGGDLVALSEPPVRPAADDPIGMSVPAPRRLSKVATAASSTINTVA